MNEGYGIEQGYQGGQRGRKINDLTRHEWDKVLEALPVLVKAKQRKLKALTEGYQLQRATLGQEIRDINGLINKIRAEFL